MNDKVIEFIDNKRAQLKMDQVNKKNETLISLGLFEKLYSDTGEKSEEYPYEDMDGKFYKKVACEVLEEEYKSIIELTSGIQKNRVSSILWGIAFAIYIVGVIAGFVGGSYNPDPSQFSLTTACGIWVAFFISGSLFLAFSEVIKLLQNIYYKL